MNTRRYSCRTVRNMLPLHAGRDLDPRHAPAVDEHLRSCLSCFREFRDLAGMRGRLGALAEDALPAGILDGFAEEVMARIAVGEPGPAAEAPRPSRSLYALPRLTAAAALLLVCVAAWRLVDDGAALSPAEIDGRSLTGQGLDLGGLRAGQGAPRVGSPAFSQGAPVTADPQGIVRPGIGRGPPPAAPDASRGRAQISPEAGPLPSAEDELLIEVHREAASGLPRSSGGLREDDPDKLPRPRRP